MTFVERHRRRRLSRIAERLDYRGALRALGIVGWFVAVGFACAWWMGGN